MERISRSIRGGWAKRTLILLAISLSCPSVTLQGQPVVEISTDRTCHTCAIFVEHVATLGKIEDQISPSWFSHVAVDQSGNFYVGPTYSPGEVAVYGPSGVLVRTLGREGEGPGEFTGIRVLRITGGDTLHVFSNGRHTVLSIAGEVIDTSPFRVASRQVFILGDGRILANASVRTTDRIGLPAHILGADGLPSFSFGNDSQTPQGDILPGTHRSAWPSGGNDVWVTTLGDYRLELWDTAGVHLQTLVRDAPWFRPWQRRIAGEPFRARPPTKIISVHQDKRGLLWVFSRVPDREWQPGFDPPAYAQVYDTVIEVVDPTSGELIISQRFDAPNQLFNWYFSEELVYSVSRNPLGLEQVQVWRMRLEHQIGGKQ